MVEAVKVKSKVKTRPAKKKYPFCFTTEEKRQKALQTQEISFKQSDPVLHHMMTHAEALFEPKQVYSGKDWLADHEERGQDIRLYRQGGPNISWFNPKRNNTIYLLVIDDSISEQVST